MEFVWTGREWLGSHLHLGSLAPWDIDDTDYRTQCKLDGMVSRSINSYFLSLIVCLLYSAHTYRIIRKSKLRGRDTESLRLAVRDGIVTSSYGQLRLWTAFIIELSRSIILDDVIAASCQ